MKTRHITSEGRTYFVVSNLSPQLEAGARAMNYEPFEDGFARSFDASLPHVDRVVDNLTRYAETMFLQTVGVLPIPWEDALLRFLRKTEGTGLNWWLRGSAALAIRGLPVSPADIDLTTDAEGSHLLVKLFQDDLIVPHEPVVDWFMSWWCVAFLGVIVEWMGEVNDSCDQPKVGDFGPEAERRAEVVTWRGYDIRVPPLDLQMKVCGRRGLTERAEMIRQEIERTSQFILT